MNIDVRPSAISDCVIGIGSSGLATQGGIGSGMSTAGASPVLRAAKRNTVSVRCDPLIGEWK